MLYLLQIGHNKNYGNIHFNCILLKGHNAKVVSNTTWVLFNVFNLLKYNWRFPITFYCLTHEMCSVYLTISPFDWQTCRDWSATWSTYGASTPSHVTRWCNSCSRWLQRSRVVRRRTNLCVPSYSRSARRCAAVHSRYRRPTVAWRPASRRPWRGQFSPGV